MNRRLFTTLLLLAGTALAAPLRVATSFSVLADLVRSVGGARVEVVNLIPPGADLHSFTPSTGDIRRMAGARLVFENGLGLESWFGKLRPSLQGAREVVLSDGLQVHRFMDQGHSVTDPHLWWDPENAVAYVARIRDALSQADPPGKGLYAQNAARYTAQIRATDAAARRLVATLPPAQRKLVTNHDALGYLARHYGFTVVGQVLPGLGTEQEPGAQDLVRLIQLVRAQGVRAIFTESSFNNRLAQTVSQETGARVAPPLYTDALGPRGSAGDTYLKALLYNVRTIVEALK